MYALYNAFGGNNCQGFVKRLEGNASSTPQLNLMQSRCVPVYHPLEKVVRGIGSHVPTIAKGVTDLAALVNKT